ncbi:uncharacterized protein CTRU02_208366 [Colletotrichum truncatum]|uniref:Uncharacterized protein n=1 Tax=Colletotrichum truncatum TaxID=5467 RepID=A0ACC3YW37_COLTU|nr:uncharacterized protein CTRU02_07448 [Colletotrichum truncatum]KAF6791108.1 hypothetical protein CTRU02_07448 [Colletotrichum truncatum]
MLLEGALLTDRMTITFSDSAANERPINPTPHRQIRANFDDDTITVYQAYSSAIADAAVESQRLDASPNFKLSRMTWIKPSWTWVLYRSGYSYKDHGQERILALKMTHDWFIDLLRQGALSCEDAIRGGKQVRIQWDPERDVRLEKLPYRSIQIGIPAATCQSWVEEGIVSIEDVTSRARELKRVLDDDPKISGEELLEMGLVPCEKEFVVPDDVQEILRMSEPRK